MSIAVYYTKLKQLWDELHYVEAIPSYTYGSVKIAIEVHNSDKLIQFLMGLNDIYDQVGSQILLLDLLPIVNEAYIL